MTLVGSTDPELVGLTDLEFGAVMLVPFATATLPIVSIIESGRGVIGEKPRAATDDRFGGPAVKTCCVVH
ncbi:hypothetical protein [Natrinema halophilum]|uniref:Uncharacterized protein n=1 Tax=Natrinema halophilum TaxID=1699371 RepID=A0A7D5K8G7_9EURY|nr:hypothetical protein [Natrinema halophilum]QLG50703.1 hypothetical protein HYG82_18605 [Natrinema halophilum]